MYKQSEVEMCWFRYEQNRFSKAGLYLPACISVVQNSSRVVSLALARLAQCHLHLCSRHIFYTFLLVCSFKPAQTRLYFF